MISIYRQIPKRIRYSFLVLRIVYHPDGILLCTSVVTGSSRIEETEYRQRVGADNCVPIIADSTREIEEAVYGEQQHPQTRVKIKHPDGLKPDLYRSQISPGGAQEYISRSMTLCEEQ